MALVYQCSAITMARWFGLVKAGREEASGDRRLERGAAPHGLAYHRRSRRHAGDARPGGISNCVSDGREATGRGHLGGALRTERTARHGILDDERYDAV